MKSEREIGTPLASPHANRMSNALSQVRTMSGRTSGPTRRSTRGQWTPDEDEILRQAVLLHNGKNWKKIAECFKDRTDVQCLHRWQKVLNPELIKGPWSKEEDEIIIQMVEKYGPKKWSTISQHLTGRIGKQCRERWHNHLNPAISKEAWTQEEEIILIRAHQIHGNKWAELTKYLPGRTDNSIKNHWHSSVKKKLDSYIASGIIAQFEGLPLVSHQSQPSMPTTSFHYDRVCKDQVEDNSECSQIGCSQTASDMSNTEVFLLPEESDHGKDQTPSPSASCSLQYCTFLDDISFTVPDLSYDNSSEIGLPFELDAEYRKDEIVHSPFHQSASYREQTLANEVVIGSENMDMEKYRESLLSIFQPNASERDASHCQSLCYIQSEVALPNQIYLDSTEQTNPVESSRSLPVNTFGHETSDSKQIRPSVAQKTQEHNEGRTLCYEPPRVSSSDFPFFSCDLAQCSTNGLQEFSPLGIRQLMVPSMNNLTPLKLWDSPPSWDSPDALLRSASKTFASTPSIIKKRHRGLMSPLSPFSERRCGKRIESEINKELLFPSRLNKEFSRLDVLSLAAKSTSPSHDQNNPTIKDKENICPVSEEQTKELKCLHDSTRHATLEEECDKNGVINMDKEGDSDHDAMLTAFEDYTSETPRQILAKCPSSETHFSTPDGTGSKTALKSSENPSRVDQSFKSTSQKRVMLTSGTYKAVSNVRSSLLAPKVANEFALPGHSISAEMAVGEIGAENRNIFSVTPFKRSIDSPSAWKSPYYFSSLTPGPRVDTDITIEDIGIFMSPGMGSMDAIGLMRQINEQNADAYADARAVLGTETPESILRQRMLTSQNPEKIIANECRLTEPRVLDFSKCETPPKSAKNSANLSSPSSCLLRNYR